MDRESYYMDYPILLNHMWKLGQNYTLCLRKKGMKVVSVWEAGFRNLSNNRKSVNAIEDVKGLKIRVPESDLYINTWKALGTNPTPIAWNEFFSAMQLGVVDGCEVPLTNFATLGFGEVQKYYAWINYMYGPIAFVKSLDF